MAIIYWKWPYVLFNKLQFLPECSLLYMIIFPTLITQWHSTIQSLVLQNSINATRADSNKWQKDCLTDSYSAVTSLNWVLAGIGSSNRLFPCLGIWYSANWYFILLNATSNVHILCIIITSLPKAIKYLFTFGDGKFVSTLLHTPAL